MAVSRDVSRRSFLAASSLMPLVAAVGAQPRRVTVGLELFSVRGELVKDLLGTVDRVAKMGYQTVEFYSPYQQWSNKLATEVRRRLDGLGVRCVSTHNGMSAFTGDTMQRAVELNQIIGSSLMVLASPPPKLVTIDGWRAFGAQMTQAVETLRPLKMSAGFHNHAAEWRPVEGQRPMDILAASTPRDFVLQLDVGTCVEAGADPVAFVRANPGRIKSMHCKEWSSAPGRGYAVAFGEGDTPWLRLFAAAEEVGGIENYLIEQEIAGEAGEFAMVERCLAAYRKLRA